MPAEFADGAPTAYFWVRASASLLAGIALTAGAVVAFVAGNLGGILLLILGLPLIATGLVWLWVVRSLGPTPSVPKVPSTDDL